MKKLLQECRTFEEVKESLQNGANPDEMGSVTTLIYFICNKPIEWIEELLKYQPKNVKSTFGIFRKKMNAYDVALEMRSGDKQAVLTLLTKYGYN